MASTPPAVQGTRALQGQAGDQPIILYGPTPGQGAVRPTVIGGDPELAALLAPDLNRPDPVAVAHTARLSLLDEAETALYGRLSSDLGNDGTRNDPALGPRNPTAVAPAAWTALAGATKAQAARTEAIRKNPDLTEPARQRQLAASTTALKDDVKAVLRGANANIDRLTRTYAEPWPFDEWPSDDTHNVMIVAMGLWPDDFVGLWKADVAAGRTERLLGLYWFGHGAVTDPRYASHVRSITRCLDDSQTLLTTPKAVAGAYVRSRLDFLRMGIAAIVNTVVKTKGYLDPGERDAWTTYFLPPMDREAWLRRQVYRVLEIDRNGNLITSGDLSEAPGPAATMAAGELTQL